MIKYIITAKYVLQYEGTFIDNKGRVKVLLTNGDGKGWAETGTYIHQRGGMENLMNELHESEKTIDELRDEFGKRLAPTLEQKRIIKNTQNELRKKVNELNDKQYSELLSNELNECTPKNICIIMRYLNRVGNEAEKPLMNIGYKCEVKQKYSRDGKKINQNYTTMELTKPIEYKGEQCKYFIFGNKPHKMYVSIFGEDGINDFND